jgi:uncharacterized RDD family membrane protein YckC
VDVTLVAWLVGQGLTALISLIQAIFGEPPGWLVAILTGIASTLVPIYLGVCWWLSGRTIGSVLVGTRVCTPDGRNPGLVRALIRALLGLVGIVVWVITGVFSLFDPRRRTWLDRMMHTEVRYVVPLDQQGRYIRQALQERQDRDAHEEPSADQPASPPEPDVVTGTSGPQDT